MGNQETEPAPDGFEWDEEKARENERKHGVSFTEAATVFDDLHAESVCVEEVAGEVREVTVGASEKERLILVVHTQRDGETRIISARKPTKAERRAYERGGA